jgi:hypothetical protein
MEILNLYFEIVVDSRISLWNLNRIYSRLSDFAGLAQTAGDFSVKNSNFLNVELRTPNHDQRKLANSGFAWLRILNHYIASNLFGRVKPIMGLNAEIPNDHPSRSLRNHDHAMLRRL